MIYPTNLTICPCFAIFFMSIIIFFSCCSIFWRSRSRSLMALFNALWFCRSISSGVFLRPNNHSKGMIMLWPKYKNSKKTSTVKIKLKKKLYILYFLCLKSINNAIRILKLWSWLQLTKISGLKFRSMNYTDISVRSLENISCKILMIIYISRNSIEKMQNK